MKTCSRCLSLLAYSSYSRKNASSDGYKSHCKRCEKVDRIKNFERDKELKKNWIIRNKEKDLLSKRRYADANRENIAKWKKDYRKDYEFNKLKTDIQHRLRNRIRARLHASYIKTGSTVEFLGCSLEEFKLHIESKFEPDMTWDNWSRTGWHIDHIKPLSSFNLEDIEQLKEACNYSNLQPLWAEDNLKKSSKV